MRLDDPFPLNEIPPRVRAAILTEFGGRRPSILEVAGIPDEHWLKTPGMGPTSLAQMRSLTQDARRKAQIASVAGMADTELLAEYGRLKDQKKAIETLLRMTRAELLLRRLISQ